MSSQRHTDTARKTLVRIAGGQNQAQALQRDWEAHADRQIHLPEKEDTARHVHPANDNYVSSTRYHVDSNMNGERCRVQAQQAESQATTSHLMMATVNATAFGSRSGGGGVRPVDQSEVPRRATEGACRNAVTPEGREKTEGGGQGRG